MKPDFKSFLASFYSALVDGKNFLYDSNILDSVSLSVPVLSVGNLSVGGTGKTPLVQHILSMAREKKITAGVVARNYRARSRGIHQIDINRPQGAAFYGDEAFLIASQFAEFPVWTGPKKYLTAQSALRQKNCQMLVVDDGFQHRSLHRDFDLVLLDCTVSLHSELLIPKGRFREGFDSLRRAQAVALTKVNWADEEQVQRLRKKVPTGVESYEVEFLTSSLHPVSPSDRILAVCGIANPQSFTKTVRGLGPFSLIETMFFGDHFDYGDREAHQILKRFRQLECHQILTTEKDFVKLSQFSELRTYLNPVRVQTRFRQEPQGLNAFLDRVAGT